MNINAISAPSASKLSVKVLTRFTTGDESVLNKFNRYYKLIVKGAVYEASAALVGWRTTRLLVLFADQAPELC